MACQTIQMWSLSGLVAAFLDLAIAHLLLCASAVAYLASTFLGFLGLNLPCPCDGMFFNIHCKSFCLNSLLVEFPTQKISDVQIFVKQKYPFSDSKCSNKDDYSVGGVNCVNGILEIQGEASCSSVSDARRPVDVVKREIVSARAGKYDMKGKGLMSHRPRRRLHQHRKGVGSQGKCSSVLTHDPPLHEEVLSGESYCYSGTNKGENGFIGGGSLAIDNVETRYLEYDNKAPPEMGWRHRAVTNSETNHSPDEEDIHIKKSVLSIEELQDNPQENQNFCGDENNAIRLLEQTLEEERIARAALYIELEKERSAAASAADEAMAMILRLQEDKASIEMEARQYQRMIEEKSAYDAEEMNILKEILVRREKEKHFLEKEVEAYRQMVYVGNEQLQLAGDDSDARQLFLGPSFDLNDDPVLILHQLNASADKKLTMENECSDENPLMVSVSNSVGSMDLQEKEIISTLEGPQECKRTTCHDAKELEQVQTMNLSHKPAEKMIVTCNGTETSDPHYPPTLKQQANDPLLESNNSCDLMLDNNHNVYDVHIISDVIEANVDKHEQLSVSSTSKVCEKNSVPFEDLTERVNVITDSQTTNETEVDVKRSSSDVTNRGLPPIGPKGLSLLSEMRRSSLSAVDSEMLKIDCEVGRLRERLKLVQEERQKLSFSVENREKENIQLKLLEDIARQIQEIRHLAEPGKAARQVSLPLPTSKALSKKRRSRSVSSGLQRSSEG